MGSAEHASQACLLRVAWLGSGWLAGWAVGLRWLTVLVASAGWVAGLAGLLVGVACLAGFAGLVLVALLGWVG